MAIIATRLTNTGNLLINGNLDEVTQATISTSADTIYATLFDEVSNTNSSIARRDSANGTVQISGIFDEFTGAPIVDSSLTMWLDFGQAASYPGSGATVYDLSSSGSADITLYNSPTFNTYDGGGAEYFNGTNQYGLGAGTPLGLTAYTKSFWVKLSSYSGNNNTVSSFNGGHFCFFATTNKIHCGHSDWPNYLAFPSNTTFSLDTWYHIGLSFDTVNGMDLFINGALDSKFNVYLTPVPGTGQVDLACFNAGNNLLTGSISQVMIYNRVLTGDEIYQNFNALRRRYNL